MFDNFTFGIKDVVALLLVLTFCLSIFLPENVVSDSTMQQFERILCTVIGFYFGAHISDKPKK